MSVYEREGHKFEYRPYGIRLLNKPKLEVGEIEKIEVADPLECPMFKTKEEAIAFAILGNETLNHHYSNVKSSTGANRYVILGQITPKPF